MANNCWSRGWSRAVMTSWNLDSHDFRAIISIEPSRCSGLDRATLIFCGARLSDFHGLLVNMDPRTNRFRLWDVDDGLVEGFGTRFLSQHQGRIWVTNFTNQLKVVDPVVGSQTTWTVGFTPAGLAIMPDGHIVMPSSGTSSGYIHQLTPANGRLLSWTLPTEQVPFGGVVDLHGGFFFAERRTSRIAHFDATENQLTEWQLPSGSNPQLISRDRSGHVWFSDANFNNRIGRLNPRRSTVAFFIKEGVVTFSVRPVSRCHAGQRIAAADLASYIDVLRPARRVTEVPVRTRTTRLPRMVQHVTAHQARLRASEVVISPIQETVQRVDPPHLVRFHTPVVAPIDVTTMRGAIYATAGGFNERQGPSRIFRLKRGPTTKCHVKGWRILRPRREITR